MFEARLAKEMALYNFCARIAISFGYMPKATNSEMITGWHIQNIKEERERAYNLYIEKYTLSGPQEILENAFCITRAYRIYELMPGYLDEIKDALDLTTAEKIKEVVDSTIAKLENMSFEEEGA